MRVGNLGGFQSPRGDFGFLKSFHVRNQRDAAIYGFQSPRGDFGFLKPLRWPSITPRLISSWFQSPRGDFGFLKYHIYDRSASGYIVLFAR